LRHLLFQIFTLKLGFFSWNSRINRCPYFGAKTLSNNSTLHDDTQHEPQYNDTVTGPLRITTMRKATLCIITSMKITSQHNVTAKWALCKNTLSIMAVCITTLSIMTLSKTAFHYYNHHNDFKHNDCQLNDSEHNYAQHNGA
jgi:hypothetical protein